MLNQYINQVTVGDCLDILKNIASNSIDLVYLDPPFFTQKNHKLQGKTGDIFTFSDTWEGIDDYLLFLEERIKVLHNILSDKGSIFIHCDKTAVHYIKVMLDRIFGINNFVNEIVWQYKRWSNNKKGLQNNHQNILFYSKSANFKFNTIYQNYSPTTNVDQILQNRVRNIDNKVGYSGTVSKVKKGVPLGDVWEIPFLNPKAKERVGYPTQKPILLIEQIIKIASDENDTILDPFCGSGTTLVAAKLLDRNYIGIDISKEAVSLAKHRLQNPVKTESLLLKKGINAYIEKVDKIELIQSIGGSIVYRNNNVDAIMNSVAGLIAVKIQELDDNIDTTINKVLDFANKKGLLYKVVVLNNSQLGSSSSIDFKNDNTIYCTVADTELLDRINNQIKGWVGEH